MTCELQLMASYTRGGVIHFTGISDSALADTTAKIRLLTAPEAPVAHDAYGYVHGSDYTDGIGQDGYCYFDNPYLYYIESYKLQVVSGDGATVYHETDWITNGFYGKYPDDVTIGFSGRTVISGTNVPEITFDGEAIYVAGLMSENDCYNKSLGITLTPGGTAYTAGAALEFSSNTGRMYLSSTSAPWCARLFADGQTIDIVMNSGEEQWVDDPDNPGMGMPTTVYTEVWRQRVTVRINLPPSAITLSADTATSSTTATVEVGAITATDANISDTHTFAIVSQTDNAATPAAVEYFAIGGSGNNRLLVAANTPAGTYNITIVCSDGIGNITQTKTVTILAPAGTPTTTNLTGFTATATSSTQITCSFTLPAGVSSSATIQWQRSIVDPDSQGFDATNWITIATTDLAGNAVTE